MADKVPNATNPANVVLQSETVITDAALKVAKAVMPGHTHEIEQVVGLQTALDGKADIEA